MGELHSVGNVIIKIKLFRFVFLIAFNMIDDDLILYVIPIANIIIIARKL